MLSGMRIRNTRPAKVLISHLNAIGFLEADLVWLGGTGELSPVTPTDVPSLIAPNVTVRQADQESISRDFYGTYLLYRGHGRGGLMIRELLHFSERTGVEQPVYLINRRGSVYRGLTYRVFDILHAYLIRAHDRFGFSSRNMSFLGTSSGSHDAMSGIMMRITKTTGRPAASDFVVLRRNSPLASETVERIEAAASSTKSINLSSFLCEKTQPAELREYSLMTEQEQLISKNLSCVINANSTEVLAGFGIS